MGIVTQVRIQCPPCCTVRDEALPAGAAALAPPFRRGANGESCMFPLVCVPSQASSMPSPPLITTGHADTGTDGIRRWRSRVKAVVQAVRPRREARSVAMHSGTASPAKKKNGWPLSYPGPPDPRHAAFGRDATIPSPFRVPREEKTRFPQLHCPRTSKQEGTRRGVGGGERQRSDPRSGRPDLGVARNRQCSRVLVRRRILRGVTSLLPPAKYRLGMDAV